MRYRPADLPRLSVRQPSPSQPPDASLSGTEANDLRLYFDLRNDQYTLPDVYGVEASAPDEARHAAVAMIRKLRQEDPSAAQDWSGWILNVTDTAGCVLFSMDLDRE
jgi:hypothetical protein